MDTTASFDLARFGWLVLIFVGVPGAIGTVITAAVASGERRLNRTGTGAAPSHRGRGPWRTGGWGVVAGFAAVAGWLSWSASAHGAARLPGLPAPNEFPDWQIIAGLVVAVAADATYDSTGQSGVGLVLTGIGGWLALALAALTAATVRSLRAGAGRTPRGRYPGPCL